LRLRTLLLLTVVIHVAALPIFAIAHQSSDIAYECRWADIIGQIRKSPKLLD
jgi:uncharacterized membrane protein YagU involved in acid resistance